LGRCGESCMICNASSLMDEIKALNSLELVFGFSSGKRSTLAVKYGSVCTASVKRKRCFPCIISVVLHSGICNILMMLTVYTFVLLYIIVDSMMSVVTIPM